MKMYQFKNGHKFVLIIGFNQNVLKINERIKTDTLSTSVLK